MKQSPPKEHKVANTPKVKDMHETDKDISSKSFISGRLQHVPVDPKAELKRTTLAAGADLWRGNPAAPEVALIHRPHYDYWSLPKVKVDSGESLPATVARELWEETGYKVKLGKLVGKVTFPVQGRTRSEGTRLNSSHVAISYAVFCLKKKTEHKITQRGKQDQTQLAETERL